MPRAARFALKTTGAGTDAAVRAKARRAASQRAAAEHAESVLDQLDPNNDGIISAPELLLALEQWGTYLEVDQIEEVIGNLDTNKDGKLSRVEVSAMLRQLQLHGLSSQKIPSTSNDTHRLSQKLRGSAHVLQTVHRMESHHQLEVHEGTEAAKELGAMSMTPGLAPPTALTRRPTMDKLAKSMASLVQAVRTCVCLDMCIVMCSHGTIEELSFQTVLTKNFDASIPMRYVCRR